MADINNFLAQGWDPVAKRNQFLQMKQRELDLQGMRNALAYQPEELEFQRYLRQQVPYENGMKALEDIVNYAPMINLDNYESFVNYAVGRGAPKQWFPAKNSFASNEDFQTQLSQQVTSVKDLMTKHAMGLKEREVKAKEITAKATMKKANQEKEPNLTEAMILALPENDPRKIAYMKARGDLAGSIEKNQTEEQLTSRALKGDKDAQAILDAMQKRKLTIAEATRQFTNPEPFNKWSKEEKEYWFESKAMGGESPRFGFGDRQSYSQFNKEYATWQKERGVTGAEATTQQAETKALKASLQNQERSFGMMSGFVGNLGKQVNRLEDITKDVKRYDTRLLNVPLVDWRTRVKGTPYENIIDMYVTEISTEMGKIASGASASIAELSVQTRQKWEKIHDAKLSINDLIQVMKETKHAADMRVGSAKEAIDDTRKRLSNVGKEKPSETPKKKTITLKSGKVIEVED